MERKRINNLDKLVGFLPFEREIDGKRVGRIVGTVKKKVLSRKQTEGQKEKGFFVVILSEAAFVSDNGKLVEAQSGQGVGVRLVASTMCLDQCIDREVEIEYLETRKKGDKTYYDIAVSV